MPVVQTEPTKRQATVLAYMLKYQRKHGMPPTLRMIAEAFGFTSPNAPLCHLRALVKKGWVKTVKRASVHRYVAIDPEQGQGVGK